MAKFRKGNEPWGSGAARENRKFARKLDLAQNLVRNSGDKF
jgi:hypothetical protein